MKRWGHSRSSSGPRAVFMESILTLCPSASTPSVLVDDVVPVKCGATSLPRHIESNSMYLGKPVAPNSCAPGVSMVERAWRCYCVGDSSNPSLWLEELPSISSSISTQTWCVLSQMYVSMTPLGKHTCNQPGCLSLGMVCVSICAILRIGWKKSVSEAWGEAATHMGVATVAEPARASG